MLIAKILIVTRVWFARNKREFRILLYRCNIVPLNHASTILFDEQLKQAKENQKYSSVV